MKLKYERLAQKKKLTAKKTSRKSTAKASKSKTKTSSRPASNRKPFGGYAINFSGRKETLEKVFGTRPIPPSEMTKKIWAFVKTNNLSTS